MIQQPFFGPIQKLVQIGAVTVESDYVGRNVALYDLIEQYTGDVPWYVEQAREYGGRVLELGCGTGRVLIPLARAGVEITGIDISRDMLAECTRKLASEPSDVQARVELVHGDMRSFTLGHRFGLAIMPLYTPVHLLTAQDMSRAFGAVARHLRPGGILLLEAQLAQGVREVPEPVLNVVRRDKATGTLLLVLNQLRWESDGTVLLNLLNVVIPRDEPATITAVSSRESRTTVTDLRAALESAGLEPEGFWGDYDGGLLSSTAAGVVVRAAKPRR